MRQPNKRDVRPGPHEAPASRPESLGLEKRIEGLDLLRGIASLMVCWFHLTLFTFQTPNGDFYNFLKSSAEYGWLGVEIFFVISGFVIPYSLHRARYKVSDYPIFILKRLVRLDPPYIVTIGVILLLSYAYARHARIPFLVEGTPVTWPRVLLHLGYLNLFFEHPWFNPVFWTLAVELQYYVLIGLAFPLISSSNRNLRITVVACLGLLCLLGVEWATPGKAPTSHFILKYAFLFLMGILTFQYVTGISKKGEYLVLLLLAVVGCYLTVGLLSALAGIMAVAVAVYYDRKSRVVAFLGNISYSLYLLHWYVGPLAFSVVASKVINTEGDVGQTITLLCALAASMAAAYLLYVLVEKPAQRWSSRLKYKASLRIFK